MCVFQLEDDHGGGPERVADGRNRGGRRGGGLGDVHGGGVPAALQASSGSLAMACCRQSVCCLWRPPTQDVAEPGCYVWRPHVSPAR